MMKDESNSGNPNVEGFLEVGLESYPNFCFKSPTKDKTIPSLESLPNSCRRTPIMSPIDVKYNHGKITKQEKTEIKKTKQEMKFTPFKDIVSNIKQNHNSADKASNRSLNIAKQQIEEGVKIKDPNKENIDYKLTKVSQSAEKQRKFVSKIKIDD